jgi:hypothetical protein
MVCFVDLLDELGLTRRPVDNLVGFDRHALVGLDHLVLGCQVQLELWDR